MKKQASLQVKTQDVRQGALLIFREYLLPARNHTVFRKPYAEGCLLLLLLQEKVQSYSAKKGAGKAPVQQHRTPVCTSWAQSKQASSKKGPISTVCWPLCVTSSQLLNLTILPRRQPQVACNWTILASCFSFWFLCISFFETGTHSQAGLESLILLPPSSNC